MSDTPRKTLAERTLDPGALMALAHPLRIEIYETLGAYGPATASKLAERLDESSGATSYHLRQLAKHDLVREVEGRGSARERWWEVKPGGISVSTLDYDQPAKRVAAEMISRQWDRTRASLLEQFSSRPDFAGRDWYDATASNTINVAATVEQLAALTEAFEAFAHEHIDPLRRQTGVEGLRRVQVHFNAFPVPDSE